MTGVIIVTVVLAIVVVVLLAVWYQERNTPYPHRADVALHKARRSRQLTDAKAHMTRRADRNIEAIHDTARRLRRAQGR
jgi:uncharacterized protein YpmB